MSDQAAADTPRPSASTSSTASSTVVNRRKAPKVSRACDRCKTKKARCSGTNPCEACVLRGETCRWDAKYTRGTARVISRPQAQGDRRGSSSAGPNERNTSRASPEKQSAEIRGQYHDLTSGWTFIHRAWKRLSMGSQPSLELSNDEKQQHVASAGDWPLAADTDAPLPDRSRAWEMLEFYFQCCVVTYRFLHHPTVEKWLEAILQDIEAGHDLTKTLGHARAAAVTSIFAIATFRQEQIRSAHLADGARNFEPSDRFFRTATNLTNQETGLPRLESVQARLLQVLYLLQTSRVNQAWYVFGNAVYMISALGLHRKPHSIWHATPRTPGGDYILAQCRKRTFWTAYILDKYLCIVLGRPTHYHDEDIDQEFPDRVNDEDMEPDGPRVMESFDDCYVDGLVAHAQLARIIGDISRDVYSIRRVPRSEQMLAARRHAKILHEWRSDLPPLLGTVRPSSLIPTFRRQSLALKLGYTHAIMHATRPFLLASFNTNTDVTGPKENILECLSAAKDALATVDSMAADGTLFYSLWWTYYVAFCALSVAYIWEIQRRTINFQSIFGLDTDTLSLLKSASRCHKHLAQATPVNSPSRAYSVLLEELRLEAGLGRPYIEDNPRTDPQSIREADITSLTPTETEAAFSMSPSFLQQDTGAETQMMPSVLDEWEATDWLNFDSSAFIPCQVDD